MSKYRQLVHLNRLGHVVIKKLNGKTFNGMGNSHYIVLGKGIEQIQRLYQKQLCEI